MSKENRSNNKRSEGQSSSIRKSFDTVPPQTGRLRNLFNELQGQQNSQQAENQQGSRRRRETTSRDDSTS